MELYTVSLLLCLAYFTEHTVLKLPLGRSMCHNLLPFKDLIIFHCMDNTTFCPLIPVSGQAGCFHLLAVVSSYAVNMGVQVSPGVPASSSSACTPRAGIAGSNAHSVLLFKMDLRAKL